MSILVVGSVALDTVKTPWRMVVDALGGSALYFSAAASYFAPINLVGVVGDDFPVENLDFLKRRQVDLEGLVVRGGKTFRWSGEYGVDPNDRETLDTQLNVFATFRPLLPERYRDSQYVFLANIDPELQRDVLDQVDACQLVLCDTMNFWIEGKLDALLEVLKRTDILVLNDAEARQLANEPNLIKAARSVMTLGPRVVIVKKGEHGAFMVSETFFFSLPAFPIESVLDPTGAGDAFAGGFVGHLAKAGSLCEAEMRRAIVYGSVMASFAVEQFSMERLRSLTHQEIRDRVHALKQITYFEDEE